MSAKYLNILIETNHLDVVLLHICYFILQKRKYVFFLLLIYAFKENSDYFDELSILQILTNLDKNRKQ